MAFKKWTTEFTPEAYKELKKLDRVPQKKILDFLTRLVEQHAHPREVGLALRGENGNFWRYRVGDWRIICEIVDQKVVVMILGIGHRREIYRFLH
jgi:mRNA interferase RelE/StbE